MLPVSLTMKAFGSFAKESSVRFDGFQGGLYLIVGETGAGKTTIFDAVVFALFGAASGSNRKPDMMHSDYAEKSEDTVVRLVFEQGGRRYTVERTIHFPKRRGAADEYGDGALDAVLTPPDGAPPVKGHAAVTKCCEELLGLNADQFRKIVMLAQGEFREFLAADAAKKSDILGRLFDSSEYIRYQNLLSRSRAALADRRKQYRDTVDTVMRTVFKAPEAEEDGALYLPGNPQLTGNLDRLIAADRQKANELAERKSDAQKAVDEINNKKGAAEGCNQKLDELFAAREHGQKLDERREETERLAREYALAEKAWRRVCPAREKRDAARDAAQSAKQDIVSLRERAAHLSEELDNAQAVVNGDGEAGARVLAISAEERKITDSLPRYDELAVELSKYARKADVVTALRVALDRANERRKDASEKLNHGQEELSSLENADAEAARAEARYAQARENAAEWSGEGGIARGVEALCEDEKALSQDEEALASLAKDAAEAEARYHQIYQAFIGGQAGLMAAELEKALRDTGGAVCPVCRSVFHAGQEHEFALLAEGTPTQAEADAAKKRFEQCEKKRGNKSSDVEKQRAALDSRKENLLARAKKLLPDCASWETLAGADCLNAASERFARAVADAKAACDEANRRQRRKAELKELCEKLTAELNTLAQETEREDKELGGAEKELAALDARIGTLRAALSYATREAAEAKRAELASERGVLDARIDAHRKAFDAAKEALDKARGELAAKEKALPGQESAAAQAQSDFSAALAANGFADSAAFEAALAPMGEDDREGWLARRQEALNAYRNDCQNTESRIRELAKQTANMSYTDLEELKKRLGEAGEARDAAENACSVQNELLKNHEDVRRRIGDALGELKKTDGAWERLDRLAELAMGASAEGGKLSFERYVMGSIFREVLSMANRRLDVMSGGRYSLVHTMNAGRSNSVAGLEIEVLDASTGKQRPANSLSGGESCQVSLSLALGLSDVVQSRAGGITLDALLIDEGFGALDSGALDNAIAVLNQLTEGNRLVGIISHVDKLEESIPQKLRVKKTARGSDLTSELS
ncbi:MAG: SMC family ATPase [Oscillospiraceae bacterium]|nr:SMC family ATPase [Oscillospiraceae bacterium]